MYNGAFQWECGFGGTTYTSGFTADVGISNAKFSPTCAKWELNISAMSLSAFIVSSPTVINKVVWLELYYDGLIRL